MVGREKRFTDVTAEEETAFYRTVMEEARDIVLVVAENGKLLYGNQAALKAYGYPLSEFHQLSIEELRAAEDRSLIWQQMGEAAQQGLLFRTKHRRANGEIFPVEVNSRSTFFDGKLALVSIVRDITETILLEEKLAQRNEALSKANQEISATHEELVASEEELRQQFEELMLRDEAIYHQNMVLSALHEVAVSLMQRRTMDELLQMMAAKTNQLLHTFDSWIYLVDEQQAVFRKKIVLGEVAVQFPDQISLTHGLVGQAYRTKKLALVYNYRSWLERLPQRIYDHCYGFVQVPLLREKKVFAILGLAFSEQRGYLTNLELSLLQQMADLAMIAIDNVALIDSFQQEIEEHKRTEAALKQSEENYRTIFQTANDGIIIHDSLTGDIVDANERACQLYGYNYSDFMAGKSCEIGTGIAPYSRADLRKWLQKAGQEGPQLFEWQKRRRDGSLIWLEVNLKQILLEGQSRVMSFVRDITERKEQELILKKSRESMQALLEAIPDPLFVLGRDGTLIQFIGQKADSYLLPQTLTGRTIFEIFPADVALVLSEQIGQALDSKKAQSFEKAFYVGRKQEEYEFRIAASGEADVLVIVRNITDRKRMQSELEYLSLHDALTDLYNRAFFEEEMKRFQRDRKGGAGILVFDVDGLKLINDTLGHAVGDLILKDVAANLKNAFRRHDVVARIGGDEFAVVLPDLSIAVYEGHCQKIRQQIAAYNEAEPVVPLSLSMGFAVSQEQNLDMVALFKEADNNMYREKMNRQKEVRMMIISFLLKALEKRDFIADGHGARMQKLSMDFALQLDLPDHEIETLRLLAYFHDIGKVGIPDSILFKADKLVDEEWVIMRQHSEIGYRIALAAPQLTGVADLILKHQEWWNGQGYPLGLKGEAIPLPCRILMIIDAFDAMTHDRPYRKAKSVEAAFAELRQYAGIQFDPALVPVFCRIMEKRCK